MQGCWKRWLAVPCRYSGVFSSSSWAPFQVADTAVLNSVHVHWPNGRGQESSGQQSELSGAGEELFLYTLTGRLSGSEQRRS